MKNEINWDLIIQYLTDSASESERIKLENWLLASIENREKYNEIEEFWKKSGNAFKDFSFDAEADWPYIYQQTIAKEDKIKKLRYLRILTRVAAVLVLALGISFFGRDYIYKNGFGYQQVNSYIANKDIKEVVLADGSVVWLNKLSELTIANNFLGRIRKVILKGEAFFEVAKNPDKPFIIQMDETITQVIGTSFNIKESEEEIKLNVISGKVIFYEAGKKRNKVELTANYQGLFNRTSHLFSQTVIQNQNYIAWKTGIISFKNTPLISICQQLSDIFHVSINVPDKDFENYTLTGTFNQAPLNEILDVIAITLNVKFTQEGNQIKLSHQPK